MKKRKLVSRILLFSSIFMILLLLFTQTPIFKNILRDTIVKNTNEILVGHKLSIDKIEGTIFTSLKLKDLNITSDTDTLLSVKEISAKYNILPLIMHKIKIHEFNLKEIFLDLEQSEDGSWNITDLLPDPDTEAAAKSDLNWNLELDKFRIANSALQIQLYEENASLPKQIKVINLELKASYKDDIAKFALDNFSLITSDPEIELTNLNVKGRSTPETLQISTFKLNTAMNQIELTAEYNLVNSILELGSFTTKDFKLVEFKEFIPELPLKEYPEINFNADLNREHLEAELELEKLEQTITVSSRVDSIYGNPEFDFKMTTTQLSINDWITDINLPSMLNLQMQLTGKGLDPQNLIGHVILQSKDSTILEKPIRTLLLEAVKEEDSGSFLLEFDGDYGIIDLSGEVIDLFNIPEFDLAGSFINLDLAGFNENSKTSSDLNCSFSLKGKGNNKDNLNAELNIQVNPSKLNEIDLDYLKTNMLYKEGYYQIINMEAENEIAYLNISGFGDLKANHEISFLIESKDLNYLRNTIDCDTIGANVAFSGSIKGNSNNLLLNSKLYLSDLVFNNFSIEELSADIILKKENDLFQADTDLQVLGFGVGDLKVDRINILSSGDSKQIENTIIIHSDSLEIYNKNRVILDKAITIELPVFELDRGDISLKTANESGKVILDDKRIRFENIQLDNNNGDIAIEGYWEPDFEQDMSIVFSQIDLTQLNGLKLSPYKINGILDIEADIKGTQLDPSLSAKIDITQPGINDYNLNSISVDLQLEDSLFSSDFQMLRNENENFRGSLLMPLDLSKAKDMSVLVLNKPIQCELQVNDFDLGFIDQFSSSIENFEGILNIDLNLSNTIQDPLITAEFDISHPKIEDLQLNSISGYFNLNNQLLESDFQIIRNENQNIVADLLLPVKLDASAESFLIPKDQPVLAEIRINNLELDVVEELTRQVEDIKGNLNLDLKITNTLNDPEINGNINLKEGQLKYPDFGIDYFDIALNSTFDNDFLHINDISAKAGAGSLEVNGNIDISQLQNKSISSYELNVEADKFEAANLTYLNLISDMKINFKGDSTGSVFNGKIEIIKSRIDLDKLQKNKRTNRDPNAPILVQTIEKKNNPDLNNKFSNNKGHSEILKNFTGKLRIIIPKNTWIKNKDMNLELSGDFEILKTGNYFELFGSINTVRGTYQLYGRKFSFEEGLISFNGGNQMNPYLDITIKHIFRDVNRTKREMRIAIKGYSINPEISFILDEETVSEADAVSYLLFGKSNNEISQSEKSQVSGYGQSDLAKTFLTKEIGSRIADQLAKTLRLNVIEFSGEENMKKGSILIGKYITNDLYMSYQKEFSIDQSKEIVPDKVSLEYEISKYFFLQATRGDEKSTGFDLYWKFKRE